MSEYYLSHHGIKGQRWGVRRYQNEDGSLTTAGKAKLQKYKDTETTRVDKYYDSNFSNKITSYHKDDKGKYVAVQAHNTIKGSTKAQARYKDKASSQRLKGNEDKAKMYDAKAAANKAQIDSINRAKAAQKKYIANMTWDDMKSEKAYVRKESAKSFVGDVASATLAAVGATMMANTFGYGFAIAPMSGKNSGDFRAMNRLKDK